MFEYTIDEKNEVLDKYFQSINPLILNVFPKKQKQKYLCMLWIKGLLEKDRFYNEKEVNQALANCHQDYAMLRRYLVDYGLVNREKDGSKYWL